MSVNKTIPKPKSPCDWITETSCEICKASYDKYRPGITFSDGVEIVRYHNYTDGGGYRSRGPVLWAMRVLKLDYWYEAHRACGENNAVPF